MKPGWRLAVGGIYLILLLASHVVRHSRAPEPLPDDLASFTTAALCAEGPCAEQRPVRTIYRDVPSAAGPDAPVVVLLQGSPGNKENFDGMLAPMRARYRLIVPDLPGFGDSTQRIPDYSVRAHARYVRALLAEAGIERAHIVGYSMGGGVALEIADQAGAEFEVASLTLLAAIGVQELELLGNYHLNHLVHGAQLAGLWLLAEGVPHFGLLDGFLLNVSYARNFYDTDQRPLRRILGELEMPVFIQHGDADFLVPPQAAVEHHRIVPHSELDLYDTDHFLVFAEPRRTADRLLDFLDRAEAGQTATRAEAEPRRLSQASVPFDPSVIPKASGLALVVIGFLVLVASLVSEDLACIGAGLMVAQGRVDYWPAVIFCFLGLFLGDLALYVAGRWLGAKALERAPLKWFITPGQLRFASDWFARRGLIVIFLSRFIPGTRLPTYFAAGALRTNALAFAAYFFFAVGVWTPILVAFSMKLGDAAFQQFHDLQRNALWAILALALAILVLVKLLIPLLSHRGRRNLVASWRRWRHWEFWPGWLFYPPVFVKSLLLALRYRSPLLFTASNPAIPTSGFVRESKSAILDGLTEDSANRAFVAAYRRLDPGPGRLTEAEAWMESEGIDFPIVAKPDAGQRGSGVAVVGDREALIAELEGADYPLVLQRYVAGSEYGLFYLRYPDQERGELFSLTIKEMPSVVGDGERTVDRLVIDDPRAVVMARHYRRALGDRAFEVPAAGERLQLVDIGTHCRGAIFLDGEALATDALVATLDRVSRRYRGFFFGRYDVRAADAEALGRGEFTVLELNGVTSEATHIYDPRHSVFAAWRTLFRQWEHAFAIGAANRALGAEPVTVRHLLEELGAYRRESRRHLR